MNIRKIALGAVMLIAAIVVSVALALVSEGLVYRDRLGLTPGMIVARQLVPVNSGEEFRGLGQRLNIQLPVDASLWFVFICIVAILVAKSRSTAE